jgi:hypothetical protein
MNNNFLKQKRQSPGSLLTSDPSERINIDATMYKELKNVKRISPGGYLIDRSIFNHGQKNAYDQYKRYICYHNNDAKNNYCKAMVKQWLNSDRWFLIRGHSSDCKNKNLADWEIKKFIERVEKFYLTEGRRKNGFRTCKKEKPRKRRIRRIKNKVNYDHEDEEEEGDEDDEDQDQGEEQSRDSQEEEPANANIEDKLPSYRDKSHYEEACRNLVDQLSSKDEEVKMLKLTIDKLLRKIEEERRVKEKFKEIIVNLSNDRVERIEEEKCVNLDEIREKEVLSDLIIRE